MQKYVNLLDLVKSFPTSIYLQQSAPIQPRTSLSKFGGKFNSLIHSPPYLSDALRAEPNLAQSSTEIIESRGHKCSDYIDSCDDVCTGCTCPCVNRGEGYLLHGMNDWEMEFGCKWTHVAYHCNPIAEYFDSSNPMSGTNPALEIPGEPEKLVELSEAQNTETRGLLPEYAECSPLAATTASCCEEGLYCYYQRRDEEYQFAQCLRDCPDGWACSVQECSLRGHPLS